jgi:hypothetical protein
MLATCLLFVSMQEAPNQAALIAAATEAHLPFTVNRYQVTSVKRNINKTKHDLQLLYRTKDQETISVFVLKAAGTPEQAGKWQPITLSNGLIAYHHTNREDIALAWSEKIEKNRKHSHRFIATHHGTLADLKEFVEGLLKVLPASPRPK